MTRNASHFARGSGVFACRCCGRNTRSTGRGDNENIRLCAECFDISGLENLLLDSPDEFHRHAANKNEALRLIAEVARLGGDASVWDSFKADITKGA